MNGVMRPGVRIAERYEIRSILGRGGTSTVYDAVDRQSERAVAVKVLDREPDPRRPERQRMLREARLLAQVGHHAIVRVIDGGTLEGDRAYLAMERLYGRTLADRMDDCFWLPLEEATSIAAQVLDALSAAHARAVLHRDVKPANIFVVDQRGPARIKLIDFGIGVDLADPRSRVTEPDVVVGTLGYLAPECLFGEDATVRSDVYAVGATIYEMLSGRKPFDFDGADVRAVLAVMARPIPLLSDLRPALPEALSSGIMRALSRRESERFSSCEEMRRACGLESALAA
jgi:eukaryotic-like serine/threonine-protein kinase